MGSGFEYSLQHIAEAAEWLLAQCADRRIILFSGDMGTGKTTLSKALVTKLGGVSKLSSPTFAIVNEYAGIQGTLYHVDLYRLKTTDEAIDAGMEDYLLSGNWCFVEWPEIILPLLRPNEFIHVKITSINQETRKIDLI
ncbi:MAG: tRNA (adenosine(37)-N6)-threonylcarbamoyltransferase complex ATPase subunit type 1 TsaE [Chitinophagales bacterium]